MTRRFIEPYQLVLLAVSTLLIILGIIPLDVLVGRLPPQLKVNPTLLFLGVYLLSVTLIDMLLDIFYVVASYPIKRASLILGLVIIALSIITLSIEIARGYLVPALFTGVAAVPGAWLIYSSYVGARSGIREPKGQLLYVLPRALGLYRYGEWLVDRLQLVKAVERAGLRYTRYELASIMSVVLLVSLIASAALVIVGVLIGKIMLLLLAPLPFAVIPLVRLHFDIVSLERVKVCEEELPYIVLWSWLGERSGTSRLEEVLEDARRSGLFTCLSRDAGRPLSRLAKIHPSRKIRQFFSYYLALRDTGGNVVAYLSDLLKTEMDNMRIRIESYGDKGLSIGTGLLSGISMLTLLLLLSFFGNPASALATSFMLLLLIGPAGYILYASLQPKLREKFNDTLHLSVSLIGLLVAVILAVIANMKPIEASILISLTFLTIYGVLFRAQLRQIKREEEGLLSLLRLVIEYSRTMSDKPITKIIYDAADEVGQPLARVVKVAAKTGQVGGAAWLTRYTLYTILRYISLRGATDPEALERLHDLVYTHVTAYRYASSRLSVLVGILLLLPPIVLWGLAKVREIVGGIAVNLPENAPITLHPIPVEPFVGFMLLASLVMGFIVSKASSLTVRDTMWPLIAGIVTVISSIVFGLL